MYELTTDRDIPQLENRAKQTVYNTLSRILGVMIGIHYGYESRCY